MLNTIIKTAVIYILIIISMRIMGKKLAGQLQPYELVITLMIAEIAAAPIDSGDTPMTAGLIPTLTLLIVYSVFSFLSLKSRKIRVFFCGRPSILISNGKLMTEEFEKLSKKPLNAFFKFSEKQKELIKQTYDQNDSCSIIVRVKLSPTNKQKEIMHLTDSLLFKFGFLDENSFHITKGTPQYPLSLPCLVSDG